MLKNGWGSSVYPLVPGYVIVVFLLSITSRKTDTFNMGQFCPLVPGYVIVVFLLLFTVLKFVIINHVFFFEILILI